MKRNVLQITLALATLFAPFTAAHAQKYHLEGKVTGIQYEWASSCSIAIHDPDNDYYSNRLQPANFGTCTLATMAFFTGTPVRATAEVVSRGLNEYIQVVLKD